MARSAPKLLTQAEYARHRKALGLPGGSRVAVHKAVNEGRITAFGPDKLIDPELADPQWERNTRARVSPEAVATAPDAGAPGDLVSQAAADPASEPAVGAPARPAPAVDAGYASWRVVREQADAEKAKAETALLLGTVVMRADVDRAFFEMFRETRDRLASCSRRMAAEVSSLATAEACEEVIDRELRIVLELLTSSFREKMGAPPKAVE